MSYITPADEKRLDQKYGGLGALAAADDFHPAGSWLDVSPTARELLARGTVGGGPVRGRTRAQGMRFARCMADALPMVPAGTTAEQAAYISPFTQHCWQDAAQPRLGEAVGVGTSGDDGTPTWMYAAGALGVAVILGGVYYATR